MHIQIHKISIYTQERRTVSYSMMCLSFNTTTICLTPMEEYSHADETLAKPLKSVFNLNSSVGKYPELALWVFPEQERENTIENKHIDISWCTSLKMAMAGAQSQG